MRVLFVSGGLVDEERVTHATKALADAVQAQRMADIRKAQAVNQQTLAKRMKVSQVRISKIEHGTLAHTKWENSSPTSKRSPAGRVSWPSSTTRASLCTERVTRTAPYPLGPMVITDRIEGVCVCTKSPSDTS